jgi:hypothetical protein
MTDGAHSALVAVVYNWQHERLALAKTAMSRFTFGVGETGDRVQRSRGAFRTGMENCLLKTRFARLNRMKIGPRGGSSGKSNFGSLCPWP